VEPNETDIRGQLERVLASEGFTNADRMSAFLRFIVDRALAGEAGQVKEYLIGVEVFDRNDQYDPRLDSIVRVEARRLRTKLDEYYAGPGREDALIISVPRGSYVPVFATRESDVLNGERAPALAVPIPASARSKTATWRLALVLSAITIALVGLAAWRTGFWVTNASQSVAIAVLPFAQYSPDRADELLAARLTDGVATELTRLRSGGVVSVVSMTSTAQYANARQPVREIAQALRADLVMETSVHREGEMIRVSARLVDARIDRKVWVEDFVAPASQAGELPRRIAKGVSEAVKGRKQ
jgi:TolB-like protein